ncbi:MAG: hypothetical protein ACP5XB_00360, partial [Isosphaeraceae bacterium]
MFHQWPENPRSPITGPVTIGRGEALPFQHPGHVGAEDLAPEGCAEGGHVGVVDGTVEERTGRELFLAPASALDLQAKVLVREVLDRVAVVHAARPQQVADTTGIRPLVARGGHL